MMVVFANNQVIPADAAAAPSVSITTDPVAMGDMDRATMVAVVNAIWGGTARNLVVQAQMSNDGVTWINGGPNDTYNAATESRITADANGAFIRFLFTFSITAGAGSGAVIFDVHCLLDHK